MDERLVDRLLGESELLTAGADVALDKQITLMLGHVGLVH